MGGGLAKDEGKRSSGELQRVIALILRRRAGGAWYRERFSASASLARSLFSRVPSRSIMEACTEIPAWPAYPLMQYTLCEYVCAHICTCSYIYGNDGVRARVYLCVMFSRELRCTYIAMHRTREGYGSRALCVIGPAS